MVEEATRVFSFRFFRTVICVIHERITVIMVYLVGTTAVSVAVKRGLDVVGRDTGMLGGQTVK